MSETQRYHVTFRAVGHSKGIVRSEVPDGDGVADAVVILSLVYPDEGGIGVFPYSIDGRTGERVSDLEIFTAWALLASRLRNSSQLGPNHRALAAALWEAFADGLRLPNPPSPSAPPAPAAAP